MEGTMPTIKSNRARAGGLAALVAAAMASPSAADAQSLEYAVKFGCGEETEGARSFAPGAYFTAINVHNPFREDNAFAFKVALAKVAGTPPDPTSFATMTLRSDQATEFDCRVIRAQLGNTVAGSAVISGFFVIQPRRLELDVVAVYSASSLRAGVASVHTERVPVRKR